MRVMDLGELPKNLGFDYYELHERPDGSREIRFGSAWTALRLASYLCWPENEAVRIGFLASNGVQFLEALRSETRRDYAKYPQLRPHFDATYKDWFDTQRTQKFEAFGGGYGPVSLRGFNDYVSEIAKAHQSWEIAGFILLVVLQMFEHHQDVLRGGASIGKAIDLLEDRGIYNKDQINKAWSRNRDVAHICGAAMLVSMRVPPDAWETQGYDLWNAICFVTIDVLLLAKALENFGLAYVPHGRREPLLTPTSIWRLPDTVPFIKDAVKTGPMPAKDLAFLSERKARRRY